MALKKRELSPAPAVSPLADASGLAGMMAAMPGSRVLQDLQLQVLTPAPDDWNFYAPLGDDKFVELIDSIQTSGLLHPIVVWKQPDDRYMILSGHNRVRAYRSLHEQTGDSRWAAIPATVLTDITRADAREIVVDSNWVQRTLTPSEKARSIYQKYVLSGRKKRSENGQRQSRYDQIAEQYGLSSRQIARYVRLGSLDDSLQPLVDSGKLPIVTALKLVDFSPECQQHLASNWADRLRSKQMDRLTPAMSCDEIDETLAEESSIVRVSFQVPVHLERRFRRMAAAWLAENTSDFVKP